MTFWKVGSSIFVNVLVFCTSLSQLLQELIGVNRKKPLAMLTSLLSDDESIAIDPCSCVVVAIPPLRLSHWHKPSQMTTVRSPSVNCLHTAKNFTVISHSRIRKSCLIARISSAQISSCMHNKLAYALSNPQLRTALTISVLRQLKSALVHSHDILLAISTSNGSTRTNSYSTAAPSALSLPIDTSLAIAVFGRS